MVNRGLLKLRLLNKHASPPIAWTQDGLRVSNAPHFVRPCPGTRYGNPPCDHPRCGCSWTWPFSRSIWGLPFPPQTLLEFGPGPSSADRGPKEERPPARGLPEAEESPATHLTGSPKLARAHPGAGGPTGATDRPTGAKSWGGEVGLGQEVTFKATRGF